MARRKGQPHVPHLQERQPTPFETFCWSRTAQAPSGLKTQVEITRGHRHGGRGEGSLCCLSATKGTAE